MDTLANYARPVFGVFFLIVGLLAIYVAPRDKSIEPLWGRILAAIFVVVIGIGLGLLILNDYLHQLGYLG